MYRICICDDEEEMLLQLKKRINTELAKLEIAAEYMLVQDSRRLMDSLGKDRIDILFLDIDMPYYSGMDIAGFINEQDLNIILIFVTSHDALVYKTFAYKPFAFIRKTYMDEDLAEFSSRIKKELEQQKQELLLSKGSEIYKIRIGDIVYMESEGNYINIVTVNDTIRFRETMTYMEKELTAKGFIRCHKGYLVHSEYIVKYKVNCLEVERTSNGVREIPIGRSYEKDVKRKILESMREMA